MKRYFKHDAESALGEGLAYMEITDGRPSRQVEVYGERLRWGDEAHNDWLPDQPVDVLELREEHEIEALSRDDLAVEPLQEYLRRA